MSKLLHLIKLVAPSQFQFDFAAMKLEMKGNITGIRTARMDTNTHTEIYQAIQNAIEPYTVHQQKFK